MPQHLSELRPLVEIICYKLKVLLYRIKAYIFKIYTMYTLVTLAFKEMGHFDT